ncbi:hypothetical protein Ancab_031431 [Ancistrocladus abbreviatus]
MAGYSVFKAHGLCLMLFLVSISVHVSYGRVLLDGNVLRNNIAFPGEVEDPSIGFDNLGSENCGDDSSRLVNEQAADGQKVKGFDGVEEKEVVWRKYGILVLNVLPKGSKLPPSGPSKRHNDFNSR